MRIPTQSWKIGTRKSTVRAQREGKFRSLEKVAGGNEDCRSATSSRTGANGVVILKYHDHISPRPTKNMPRWIELNLREPFCLFSSLRSFLWWCVPEQRSPGILNHVRITVGIAENQGGGTRSTPGQLAFWKHLNSYTRINSKNFTRDKI